MYTVTINIADRGTWLKNAGVTNLANPLWGICGMKSVME